MLVPALNVHTCKPSLGLLVCPCFDGEESDYRTQIGKLKNVYRLERPMNLDFVSSFDF